MAATSTSRPHLADVPVPQQGQHQATYIRVLEHALREADAREAALKRAVQEAGYLEEQARRLVGSARDEQLAMRVRDDGGPQGGAAGAVGALRHHCSAALAHVFARAAGAGEAGAAVPRARGGPPAGRQAAGEPARFLPLRAGAASERLLPFALLSSCGNAFAPRDRSAAPLRRPSGRRSSNACKHACTRSFEREGSPQQRSETCSS